MSRSGFIFLAFLSSVLANAEVPASGSFDITVTNAAVERIDFGPDAAAGYAQFEVADLDPSASNTVLRIAYANHPDGLSPKGDFWRETSARYLGDDVDLPILPANIDRYELYTLDHIGTYRAKLLQGLVRYVRFSLDSTNGVVAIRNFRLVNDKVHSEGERAGFFRCSDQQLAHLWDASVRTCELSAIPSYVASNVSPPVVTLPYLADGAGEYSEYTLDVYENWEDERWVDVTAPEWQWFVVHELAEDIRKKGFDGVFVDNLDVYYHYPSEEAFKAITGMLIAFKDLGFYVSINGGDVFVTEYLERFGSADWVFDAVNQETVFSKIIWDEKDKFDEQDSAEREYFQEYLEMVHEKGIDVYLLEYTKDKRLTRKIRKYCKEKGYRYYVSGTLNLDAGEC